MAGVTLVVVLLAEAALSAAFDATGLAARRAPRGPAEQAVGAALLLGSPCPSCGTAPTAAALCRDCDHVADAPFPRCPACGSRRVAAHPELLALSVAHVDCDAFYASVEKRDRPDLLTCPSWSAAGAAAW